MARKRSGRFRVGRVSVYPHHGAWWIYYRDGRPVRRKVGRDRTEAEQVAAKVHAQLAEGAPTLLGFVPIGVAELRRRFLDYHESVLHSTLGTVRRYRAATRHLVDFDQSSHKAAAHQIDVEDFAAYLRRIEVAPNGHPSTPRRRLRHKGIRFILETCRAMYQYAFRKRNLPPYAGNPFVELPLDRLKIEDAKPIFVFDRATELAFFRAATPWSFPIHFTLAKTGLRVGELVHLLIEDLDLEGGWLTVANKSELGWRTKTGQDRRIPLLPEVAAVLRRVLGTRTVGPVFLREKLQRSPQLVGDARRLKAVLADRIRRAAAQGPLTRQDEQTLARRVWREAGVLKADAIRNSFVRTMASIGHPESTCPKSWRHTFATLLQDANVDPLIRQLTLGHRPTLRTGLGMTANYTHTRPETQRRQIEDALRRWPESLAFAAEFSREGGS